MALMICAVCSYIHKFGYNWGFNQPVGQTRPHATPNAFLRNASICADICQYMCSENVQMACPNTKQYTYHCNLNGRSWAYNIVRHPNANVAMAIRLIRLHARLNHAEQYESIATIITSITTIISIIIIIIMITIIFIMSRVLDFQGNRSTSACWWETVAISEISLKLIE